MVFQRLNVVKSNGEDITSFNALSAHPKYFIQNKIIDDLYNSIIAWYD